MQVWKATAVLLVLVGVPATARGGVAFAFDPASNVIDCPAESDLRADIVGALGRDPFGGSGQAAEMRLSVSRSDESLRVDIVWRAANGQTASRELLGTGGCRELLSAALLPVVMALDVLSSSEATPEPNSKVLDGPVVAAEKDPGRAPEPRATKPAADVGSRPRDPWKLIARPEIGVTWGLAVPWALTAGGALGAAHSWLRVDILGQGSFTRDVKISGGQVETQIVAAGLSTCFARGWFDVCALGLVARVSARGVDLSNSRTDRGNIAFAGAGVGAVWPQRARLAIRAEVRALAALSRIDLALSGENVWRSSPLAIALLLGGPLRLW